MNTLLLRIAGTTGLCLILILTIGFFAFRSADEDPLPTQIASALQIDSPDTRQPSASPIRRSDVYYQAITDRPIFSETRRPFTPEQAPPEPVSESPQKTTEAPPLVRLLGVMSGAEQTRVLVSVDGNTPIWLSQGEKIGAWTISETGTDWFEIASGEQSIRLDLYE